MKKNNTVRVESDTSTLLQALRATFTDHTKVLGELLQNGRRAKATQIDITVTEKAIVFADNGVGIEDPSVLLSVARSGWDAATKEEESAYGIGFISTLFACETVSVQSKGQHLIALTQDLIALKPVMVNESADIGVTEIRLLDHRLGSVDYVERKIKSLVLGFPIQVSLNGTLLDRNLALEHGEWLEGEICSLRAADALKIDRWPRYFLQGLPISVTSGYQGDHRDLPIHLKSPQVKGRLPERDCVLEPEAVRAAVDKDRRELAIQQAKRLAEQGDFATLLTYSKTLATLGLLDLLTPGNRIPDDVLNEVNGDPFYPSYSGEEDNYVRGMTGVTIEQLKAIGTIYANDSSETADDVLALHYIKDKGGIFLSVTAHEYESWLSNFVTIIHIDGNDISVSGQGERGKGTMDAWSVNGVTLVDSITLSHSELGDVEMGEGSAIFDPTEGVLYVTPRVSSTYAVEQCDGFVDENDNKDEAEVERLADALNLLMMEVFGAASPEALMEQILRDRLPSLPRAITGRSFTVTFDANGQVSVTA